LYRECAEAELVGIYDANEENARRVAAELGTQVYATPDALSEAVEAMSVAVPTDGHYAVVKRLLEQGKHVLVEKPIAQTVAEAEELVALAESKGLVFGVGHVERFNPVLDSLAEVPGLPRFIEVQRLAGYPPPRPGLPPRGTEVSVVLDLMIHDIDVVLNLVGSAVKKIDAVGVSILSPTEDIANVRLLFENGCVATLTASRVSQECLRKIRVFKPAAYLSLDYQEQRGEIAGIAEGKVWRQAVPVHPRNALQVELQDFCQSIASSRGQGHRHEPRVSGVAGLAALKVAEQIIAEIAAGS
jgi:predicted dehydrogenase